MRELLVLCHSSDREGHDLQSCRLRLKKMEALAAEGLPIVDVEIPMKPNGLVVDENVFSALSAECEKIIDTRQRLPDFVFRRRFAKYFAIEYAHIYKKEFAAFLFSLSNIFGDESVNYMTLDPSPEDSGYRRRSYFGLASFEPSSLVQKYVPTLFRDQKDSKILVGVNVGAFWGSSLQWAIFCDRKSWKCQSSPFRRISMYQRSVVFAAGTLRRFPVT